MTIKNYIVLQMQTVFISVSPDEILFLYCMYIRQLAICPSSSSVYAMPLPPWLNSLSYE